MKVKTGPFQHRLAALLISATTLFGMAWEPTKGASCVERFCNHDRWDANTEEQNHAHNFATGLRPEPTDSQAVDGANEAASCTQAQQIRGIPNRTADLNTGHTEAVGALEFSSFFAWELYHRTGEIKGGFGVRGRYWFNEVGVEAKGLSLTPRDSIVDRSDLSVCWRYQFGDTGTADVLNRSQSQDLNRPESLRRGVTAILSAGYGSNWEDHAHGPGIGVAVQYNRGKWFMEAGTRSIWEDHSKSLLTFGIGRRF